MNDNEKQMIEETVSSTLTQLGFDLSDPIGAQEDMAFLRSLRNVTHAAGMRAVMVLVGLTTVAMIGGLFVVIGRAIKQAI